MGITGSIQHFILNLWAVLYTRRSISDTPYFCLHVAEQVQKKQGTNMSQGTFKFRV